jgi:hypothetical protein
MNATKTILAGAMNFVALVLFVGAGKIWWPQTGVMLVGAVSGGYLGAQLGRRMDQRRVRTLIVLISVTVTIVFFLRR